MWAKNAFVFLSLLMPIKQQTAHLAKRSELRVTKIYMCMYVRFAYRKKNKQMFKRPKERYYMR